MVMLSSTLKGRVLKFHSKALAANTLLVVSAEGREALSQPYRFDLELVSEKADIDSQAVLENPAFLGIKQGVAVKGSAKPGLQTLKIHGVFSSFEQCEKGMDWVLYRAVMVPRLWRLSLNVRTRIFLEKTIPEIVEEVVKDNGLAASDYEMKANGRSYPKQEYVVQYQESDLNFISRLLEHEGIFYFFKQENDAEKVIFADSSSAFEPIAGETKIAYKPVGITGNATQAPEWFDPEVVRRLQARHNVVPNEVVLEDYNYRTPKVDLKASAEVVSHGIGKVYQYGDHYKDVGEGKALAQVRAEELKCREKTFAGVGDVRSFRAGAIYTLKKHYRSDFNQKYLLIEVRHKAKQALALASPSNPVASYENEFVGIPADLSFRPERVTPKPKIAGAVNAKIDAAGSGQYAELDDEGRYKVKIPFDLSDRRDGKASRFMRMAQPYLGDQFGMHFPLHKGMEVAVTHVLGDPNRPIISAALPDPEVGNPVKKENQTQCVLKSGGNNELRYEDTEGDEEIFLHAEKNWTIVVENDKAQKVGNDESLNVAHDRKKKVGNDQIAEIGQNDAKTVGASMSEEIAENRQEVVGKQKTVSIGKDFTETVSGEHSHTVVKGLTVNAKTIHLVAKDEIVIKTGKATFIMKKSGEITLEGKDIVVKGSGDVTIKGKNVLEN